MPDNREEELRELCRNYFEFHEVINEMIADGVTAPYSSFNDRATAIHRAILNLLGIEREDWRSNVNLSNFNNATDFENAVVNTYLKNLSP